MLDHVFQPGRFNPDRCQVMLARYRCPYPAEEHAVALLPPPRPVTEDTTASQGLAESVRRIARSEVTEGHAQVLRAASALEEADAEIARLRALGAACQETWCPHHNAGAGWDDPEEPPK